MNEMLTSLMEFLGLAWWIEIETSNPECIYYFGPYANQSEADAEAPGFIQDLEGEGAKIVKQVTKRAKPERYTIYDESLDFRGPSPRPVFSGQS